VNHYRGEAGGLLDKLSTDADEHIRKAAADAKQFLDSRELET